MEKITVGPVTLEGYAQGGVRTSIGVPEIGALFDTGTVIPTALRYNNIFLTHGHMDHSGSIMNILARRALNDMRSAKLYVPNGLGTKFEELFKVMESINGGKRYKLPVIVRDKNVDDEIDIKSDIKIRGVKTYHSTKSIGWQVLRTTKRLKKDFKGMEGHEIGALKKKGVQITDDVTTNILTIPGDTTIDFLIKQEAAQKAEVLVHEVTYWDDKLSSIEQCQRYGHTHVNEMISHCEKFEGKYLVLCHRSLKYSRSFAERVIRDRFPASMKSKILLFDGGDH